MNRPTHPNTKQIRQRSKRLVIDLRSLLVEFRSSLPIEEVLAILDDIEEATEYARDRSKAENRAVSLVASCRILSQLVESLEEVA